MIGKKEGKQEGKKEKKRKIEGKKNKQTHIINNTMLIILIYGVDIITNNSTYLSSLLQPFKTLPSLQP